MRHLFFSRQAGSVRKKSISGTSVDAMFADAGGAGSAAAPIGAASSMPPRQDSTVGMSHLPPPSPALRLAGSHMEVTSIAPVAVLGAAIKAPASPTRVTTSFGWRSPTGDQLPTLYAPAPVSVSVSTHGVGALMDQRRRSPSPHSEPSVLYACWHGAFPFSRQSFTQYSIVCPLSVCIFNDSPLSSPQQSPKIAPRSLSSSPQFPIFNAGPASTLLAIVEGDGGSLPPSRPATAGVPMSELHLAAAASPPSTALSTLHLLDGPSSALSHGATSASPPVSVTALASPLPAPAPARSPGPAPGTAPIHAIGVQPVPLTGGGFVDLTVAMPTFYAHSRPSTQQAQHQLTQNDAPFAAAASAPSIPPHHPAHHGDANASSSSSSSYLPLSSTPASDAAFGVAGRSMTPFAPSASSPSPAYPSGDPSQPLISVGTGSLQLSHAPYHPPPTAYLRAADSEAAVAAVNESFPAHGKLFKGSAPAAAAARITQVRHRGRGLIVKSADFVDL